MTMRAALLLAFAGTLALAGCDRSVPEDEAPVNDSIELPVETPTPVEVINEVAPAENATAELPPPAPPPTFSEEQQMHDDADATGLTSRLPDSETGEGATDVMGSTGNEARPAE